MKITPLEIRQKTFEKNFRGYEKDEVHAFLLTLSQEWEKMQDENKELRIKLEATEREVLKLREVEGSLYKTLKTAEDTGANVIEQARKAAELHLKESQLKADALIQEAKSKAKDTIEESESRAKQIVEDMEDRLKALVENYKKLDGVREDLLADLKRLGSDLLERVERSKQATRDFDADKHLHAVRRETRKIVYPNMEERNLRQEVKLDQKTEGKPPEAQVVEPMTKPDLEPAPVHSEREQKKVQKSFFDEIS
ncbi:MAG TPA: DivIVA domain-containing protein [Chryseosolibacter sp.]|nr:DivIVA domain-containing protein [Chryseosolibacter sp.]